jgi:hypothetical protein
MCRSVKGELVPSRRPRANVFLNIPYDRTFDNLYLAYISGVSAFGLVPRATLEIPGGAERLDRILSLIRDCPYSIHDLSRVQLDRASPSTPRFNMPFELGLAVACERIGRSRQVWFVLEALNRRLNKSLSDLNGTDPYIHDGHIGGVFRELCSCFARERRRPSVGQMWGIYRDVKKALPIVLRRAGTHSLYQARVFTDICVVASASADSRVV